MYFCFITSQVEVVDNLESTFFLEGALHSLKINPHFRFLNERQTTH